MWYPNSFVYWAEGELRFLLLLNVKILSQNNKSNSAAFSHARTHTHTRSLTQLPKYPHTCLRRVCVCVTQFLSCTPGEDCVIFTTWLSEYSIHDFIKFLKLLCYFWLHTSSSSVYSLCVTRDLSAIHRSTCATLLILALHGHWQSQSVSAKSLSVLDTNYKPDAFFYYRLWK